jgi:hypothetical protein
MGLKVINIVDLFFYSYVFVNIKDKNIEKKKLVFLYTYGDFY